MQVTSRLDFADTPAKVFEMMTDEVWLNQIAEGCHATAKSISVSGNRTVIDMSLHSPKRAVALIGPVLELIQRVNWSDCAADGSRTGTMTIDIKGVSAHFRGLADLTPGGQGTIVNYAGDLRVNIPIVGRQLEKIAAPYIEKAIRLQQTVGDAYLARPEN